VQNPDKAAVVLYCFKSTEYLSNYYVEILKSDSALFIHSFILPPALGDFGNFLIKRNHFLHICRFAVRYRKDDKTKIELSG